jgi:hypothetical protein
MGRRTIPILVLVSATAIPLAAYCQTSPQQAEVRRVTGRVADIDWVAGEFSLKTDEFGSLDEVTFMVSSGTQITKGTNTIGFADVNLSDELTVEYRPSFAGLQALQITVQQ